MGSLVGAEVVASDVDAACVLAGVVVVVVVVVVVAVVVVVEKGAVCRIPVDGNKCPYVFTWSDDRSVWGHGSGASIFYNASLDGRHNTEMDRILEEDRFEIRAIKDVAV